jgi:hypothetical protein
MDRPKLLSLLRQEWWWLAIVVTALWVAECVIEGNTLLEMVMGPVIVATWMASVFVIDRWVFRAPRPER